jgi:hypothetical protein
VATIPGRCARSRGPGVRVPFAGVDGDKTPTGPYFDSGEHDGPVGVPVQRYAGGVFVFRPLLERCK